MQSSPSPLLEAAGISFFASIGFYCLIGRLDPEECASARQI